MCNCDQNKTEYHTAEEYQTFPTVSDFETSPEEWRTSTRYYEERDAPEYTSTPRRIIRRDYQRLPRRDYQRIPRVPPRNSHRLDLTTGVAIVPRRIDFDARSDVEDVVEEDLEQSAREFQQRLRSAQRPIYESTAAPGTYILSRSRRTPEVTRSSSPDTTRIVPCGRI